MRYQTLGLKENFENRILIYKLEETYLFLNMFLLFIKFWLFWRYIFYLYNLTK